MNNPTPDFLLFLPHKVADVILELNEHVTERLLQRDINAFDWHVADLWRAAVYYAVGKTPARALPYYHRLLEWTEADAQAHSDVLCATAHVFALEGQYEDASRMLQIAIKKARSPGRIPFFIAKVAHAQGQLTRTFNAINFFLHHHTTPDALRLHAQSIRLKLLDEAGYSEAAQELLSLMAREQNTWETHFLAATFTPYISLGSPSQKIRELQASHEEHLTTLSSVKEASPLVAWYLPQHYKSMEEPYGPDAQAYLARHQHHIQERMNFLTQHVFTAPNLKAYPAEQKRIAIIGDFAQESICALSTLWIKLCREQSVTLMSTGAFSLDISEEHWIRTLNLDSDLERAYTQVRMQQPHLIIYLHSAHLHKYSSFLGTQRLAPWQVVWATEPVLTLSNCIDEVLLYEASTDPTQAAALFPDCQLTYLPGTPIKKRLTPLEAVDGAHFNFDPERHYYLCPFPIPEIHHDFYAQCAEILTQDPVGDILFLASNTPSGERHWQQQLQKRYPEVAARMHILPPLNPTAERGVVQNVNVLLEPFYNPLKHAWWQRILWGTPAVHYDEGQVTGTWLKKIYAHMHWTESVVTQHKDYAPCAVRLARDPEAKARYQTHLAQSTLDFNSLTQFVEQWLAQKTSTDTEGKPIQ